jgi:Flp pilus assembly protein CpaB
MVHLFRRRLPRSAIAWFAAAGVAAALAALAAQAHLSRLSSTRPDLGPPAAVVVAAADLARGTTLHTGSVLVAEMPSALVPPGALTQPQDAAGRALAADLAAGEVLTRTRLTKSGAGPVAGLVPPGLRAFALPAGPPAGTVRPGDAVDVLATYGANAGRPYTETVASSLEVLDVVDAAGAVAATGGGVSGPPIIVLADPLTVERLARAAGLAVLTIAIVGDEPLPSPEAPPFLD